MARQDGQADYMAPFLAMMGHPDVDELSVEQAYRLRELCLTDYKQQLVHRAELIHARFENVRACLSLSAALLSCVPWAAPRFRK